ncbi:MAG: hypothetical protein UY21_C0008G0013 [Microgenomates group bacterium GW2011_GWA1_48_10]|uniref:Serine aminopeptidase S33 domain-containing protein n=1 Tax=Candidatus Gottesmanbacteria bacterium RIFCSPHIGHO2_01_FULL_47_48 TaxID=1798381 RepID=A0A1F6A2Z4_9BACT|nr:MAG: hypothetical protein UY21_C0008G0013 [Microgenomates group bacterium GW2011_GWA1_48_10]OGG19063.1 MAG: hypothetical protein A2721_00680 [Candidatus Gottesmanbacteria bacterium RIFCSPHIGHO2_01_FULL_47_48]
MKIKTKDNFELDVLYNKIEKAKGVIVFAHGMTVNKDDEGIFVRADKELQKLGFSTLRFDFRAHGKSQGESVTDFTISNELKDLDAIMAFVQNEGYSWIGLAGASFGGGVSALFAGQHQQLIQKLFLANPVLDYEKCFIKPTTTWAKKHFENIFERVEKEGYVKIGSRQFKAGRKLFEEASIYHPCETLKSYTNPLLIVHGDQDSKVAFQDVLDCFQDLPSTNKRFEKIEDSEHGFHDEPFETQVTEMIVKFFTEG